MLPFQKSGFSALKGTLEILSSKLLSKQESFPQHPNRRMPSSRAKGSPLQVPTVLTATKLFFLRIHLG